MITISYPALITSNLLYYSIVYSISYSELSKLSTKWEVTPLTKFMDKQTFSSWHKHIIFAYGLYLAICLAPSPDTVKVSIIGEFKA